MPATPISSAAKAALKNTGAYIGALIAVFAGMGLILEAIVSYIMAGGVTVYGTLSGLLGAASWWGAWYWFKLGRRLQREGEVEDELHQTELPQQPWKWKEEWQGPIVDSTPEIQNTAAWAAAIVVGLLTLIGAGTAGPGLWKQVFERQEYIACVGLIAPLFTLLLVNQAISTSKRSEKFGRSRFVPSTVPGVIGGYLGGVVDVTAALIPEGDVVLKLCCVRIETTRWANDSTTTNDNVLWEHEERIERGKFQAGAKGAEIPVLFFIPPGLPVSDTADTNGKVEWRLSVAAFIAEGNFSARFVVPVFATGETALPPEKGKPLLETYREVVLDDATLKRCGIEQEGGVMSFSTSHMSGMKITFVMLPIGLAGLLVIIAELGDVLTLIFFGFVILFIFLVGLVFAFDVWFGDFTLKIAGDDIEVTARRPWGPKVTRLSRENVSKVQADKSAAVGDKIYFTLSLIKAQYEDSAADQNPALGNESVGKRVTRMEYTVPFAKYVLGQTQAEAICDLVLGAIRRK